jgi:porphobilinogen synthase
MIANKQVNETDVRVNENDNSTRLQVEHFRRLQLTQQCSCIKEDMLMIIDVDLDLHGKNSFRKIGKIDDHFAFSVETAILYINLLTKNKRIKRYVLRISKDSIQNPVEKTNYFIDAIYKILDGVIDGNEIIIDLFGLASNQQLQWGIFKDQNFNLNETEKCLYNFCNRSAKLDISGILTLGRIATEVEVAKQAIRDAKSETQICSFSSNQETSFAYINNQSPKRIYDTGQKILAANTLDMNLWSLIDIWCGTNVSIIKPLENYSVISNVYDYLVDRQKREQFLDSDFVQKSTERNRHVRKYVEQIRSDYDALDILCEATSIGAYAVSGRTYLLQLLEQDNGIEMRERAEDESFLMVKALSKDRFWGIMDRSTVKRFG